MTERNGRKKARDLLTKGGYKLGGHLGRGQNEKSTPQPAVKAKKRKDGGMCDGMAPSSRGDKKPRGSTTVNVLIAAGKSPAEAGPGPDMAAGQPAPKPIPPGMQAAMGGGQPPPVAAPMPSKSGGRMKSGGKAKKLRFGGLSGMFGRHGGDDEYIDKLASRFSGEGGQGRGFGRRGRRGEFFDAMSTWANARPQEGAENYDALNEAWRGAVPSYRDFRHRGRRHGEPYSYSLPDILTQGAQAAAPPAATPPATTPAPTDTGTTPAPGTPDVGTPMVDNDWMNKKGGRAKRKDGGPVVKLAGSASGGLGRLQKAKAQRKR